jgi:hypothetical protein
MKRGRKQYDRKSIGNRERRSGVYTRNVVSFVHSHSGKEDEDQRESTLCTVYKIYHVYHYCLLNSIRLGILGIMIHLQIPGDRQGYYCSITEMRNTLAETLEITR